MFPLGNNIIIPSKREQSRLHTLKKSGRFTNRAPNFDLTLVQHENGLKFLSRSIKKPLQLIKLQRLKIWGGGTAPLRHHLSPC